MGPIGCPETSAINYLYTLGNNPEERGSESERGLNLHCVSEMTGRSTCQLEWQYNIKTGLKKYIYDIGNIRFLMSPKVFIHNHCSWIAKP
jgi:hypothetical protein